MMYFRIYEKALKSGVRHFHIMMWPNEEAERYGSPSIIPLNRPSTTFDEFKQRTLEGVRFVAQDAKILVHNEEDALVIEAITNERLDVISKRVENALLN